MKAMHPIKLTVILSQIIYRKIIRFLKIKLIQFFYYLNKLRYY